MTARHDAPDRQRPRAPLTVIRPKTGLFDLELAAVWRYRDLMYFLVWRDLKVRYSQAALGTGWAILQPLLAAAIFSLIFGMFARLPSDGVPYPLFVLSAILPWTLFAESARRSALGLVGDSDLVKKVYFPRLVIPLANVLTPLVDFFASAVILAAMMAWYGIVPTWTILFLPLFIALAVLMGLAFGLWLGPVNVKYHDVMHTLPFLLQLWMYATPVVYPLELVPQQWRALYSLNPTVGLIEGFRWCLFGTGTIDAFALTVSLVAVVVALCAGVVFFRSADRRFADII